MIAETRAAVGRLQSHAGRPFVGKTGIQGDPEKTTLDFTIVDQIASDAIHHVDRNGKSNPVTATAIAGDGRINSNDFTSQVDQRAATVTRVNRRVRLHEVLVAARPGVQAPGHAVPVR